MKYMPVGIGDILRALHTGFQKRAADHGVAFLLEQDDDLPWVPGDNDDLYRAFYNVVDNAMRYTPPKGTITIRARRVNNERFEVEVEDTGSGIEDADLPHIFERFFRGDRAHSTPGFGLGLPVTRRIIERHDGAIEVETRPGVGSKFTISLPLRQSHIDTDTLAQAQIT
jgi:signal transduction histidine kinase